MSNEHGLNLVPALRESLTDSIGDTMIDISEVFLDTIFEDGILKDIPIIGTFAGLV